MIGIAILRTIQPPLGPEHQKAGVERKLGFRMIQIPEICREGTAKSDFQKERCSVLEAQWYKDLAWAALPFVLSVGFVLIVLDSVGLTYRRVRRRMEAKEATAFGTATTPVETRNDIFGWLYGLRSITVEFSDQSQLRVYLPLGAPIPMPGQRIALIASGKAFGEPRFFAALNAPHVAIFSGGR